MTRVEADRVEDALNYILSDEAWKAVTILHRLVAQARHEHALEDRHHDLEEAEADCEYPPLMEAAE
jgi:hypothetical protein